MAAKQKIQAPMTSRFPRVNAAGWYHMVASATVTPDRASSGYHNEPNGRPDVVLDSCEPGFIRGSLPSAFRNEGPQICADVRALRLRTDTGACDSLKNGGPVVVEKSVFLTSEIGTRALS